MKFNRQYQLDVQLAATPNIPGSTRGYVSITLPFTVEFSVYRAALAVSQTATFTVYNLSEEKRRLLHKDIFVPNDFRVVRFKAGYENEPQPYIFIGSVKQAYSIRQGTEFRTVIECYDGGFPMANSWSARTEGPNQTGTQLLQKLATDLVGMQSAPVISSTFSTTNLRATTFFGPTWGFISTISQGLAFIGNSQLVALGQNERLPQIVPEINSDNGLLGVPKRTGTFTECEILFEPRISLYQTVTLRSLTNSYLNNTYRVQGFSHQGIISPAVNGEAKTTLQLFAGILSLNEASLPLQ